MAVRFRPFDFGVTSASTLPKNGAFCEPANIGQAD
jgi:hypothetical protein